jgi:hypothetical protein
MLEQWLTVNFLLIIGMLWERGNLNTFKYHLVTRDSRGSPFPIQVFTFTTNWSTIGNICAPLTVRTTTSRCRGSSGRRAGCSRAGKTM